MTVAEVCAFFERATCPPYRLRVYPPQAHDGPDTLRCLISIVLPDRDNDQPVDVHREFFVTARDLTPRRLCEHLRYQLHQLVCHEIDEMLSVDGVRVFEPHPRSLLKPVPDTQVIKETSDVPTEPTFRVSSLMGPVLKIPFHALNLGVTRT